jgi:molybdopterin converting factor subunit 1
MKKIDVTYFAILREQRGLSREQLETSADTPAELYTELRRTHSFTLDGALVKAAVNGAFVPMEQPLSDGDAIVFVPPVAGG